MGTVPDFGYVILYNTRHYIIAFTKSSYAVKSFINDG